MSERLEFAFGYVIDPELWPDREEAKLIAKKTFFDTLGRGPFPDGIRIFARWRNPDNANPRHANWKTSADPGQSLPDFYDTLHGARGALRQAKEDTDRKWADYAGASKSKRAKPRRPRKRV